MCVCVCDERERERKREFGHVQSFVSVLVPIRLQVRTSCPFLLLRTAFSDCTCLDIESGFCPRCLTEHDKHGGKVHNVLRQALGGTVSEFCRVCSVTCGFSKVPFKQNELNELELLRDFRNATISDLVTTLRVECDNLKSARLSGVAPLSDSATSSTSCPSFESVPARKPLERGYGVPWLHDPSRTLAAAVKQVLVEVQSKAPVLLLLIASLLVVFRPHEPGHVVDFKQVLRSDSQWAHRLMFLVFLFVGLLIRGHDLASSESFVGLKVVMGLFLFACGVSAQTHQCMSRIGVVASRKKVIRVLQKKTSEVYLFPESVVLSGTRSCTWKRACDDLQFKLKLEEDECVFVTWDNLDKTVRPNWANEAGGTAKVEHFVIIFATIVKVSEEQRRLFALPPPVPRVDVRAEDLLPSPELQAQLKIRKKALGCVTLRNLKLASDSGRGSKDVVAKCASLLMAQRDLSTVDLRSHLPQQKHDRNRDDRYAALPGLRLNPSNVGDTIELVEHVLSQTGSAPGAQNDLRKLQVVFGDGGSHNATKNAMLERSIDFDAGRIEHLVLAIGDLHWNMMKAGGLSLSLSLSLSLV